MLSVAVLSNAAGDISDVAVLSSSNTLFAKFDKLLNIRPDATQLNACLARTSSILKSAAPGLIWNA